MNVVRYRAAPESRWKNGRGSSRVLAAEPSDARYDAALLWQVSIPEIDASGAFSDLPGLDRQWMLLEGAGAELHCAHPAQGIDFRHRIAQPLDALAFQGDWSTDCTLLGGPVKALSILTRRGRAGARLRALPLVGAVEVEKAADERLVIVAARGQVRAHVGGEALHPPLARLDAIVDASDCRASYSLSPGGWNAATVVVATIGPI